jgi:hypothetical protein
MSDKAVIGIVESELQAVHIIEELHNAGFSPEDISLLAPDTGSHPLGTEKSTKAPEGATTGAVTGGVLGGVIGMLAGVGSIAIPGLGAFIAAGPIMAALGGAAAGATAGGVTGALIGLGIPEYEAKQYEARMAAGNLLISVHTDDSDQRTVAKKVLERHGAKGVATAGESTPPKSARKEL